jgi:CRP/FNR family transcriptional regulator
MEEQNKTWYLQQINLFKGISDAQIMQIANKVLERKCRKKELIYSPEDNHDHICVLKKGEVTLYHHHYGKKLIIETLKPGSIFGNLNFQDSGSDHFAEATEDAFICCFTKEDFLSIIRAKPEIMIRLITLMSDRINKYEKRIKNGLFDAKEKIIHHIETLNERKGILAKLSRKKALTHEKIAEHVGLSRETVTRAIKALKKEGKIASNENGLIINVT